MKKDSQQNLTLREQINVIRTVTQSPSLMKEGKQFYLDMVQPLVVQPVRNRLSERREDRSLKSYIGSSFPPLSDAPLRVTLNENLNPEREAERLYDEFQASRELYDSEKARYFRPLTPSQSGIKTVLEKSVALQFITRIPGDIERLKPHPNERAALRSRTVDVSIHSRNAFFTDPSLSKLAHLSLENLAIVEALMQEELYKEKSAMVFMMVKGPESTAEFNELTRLLGNQLEASFAGPRRETARAATDNATTTEGKHPLVELDLNTPEGKLELERWSVLYPKLSHIPWVKNWRASRTHMLAYKLTDFDGKPVFAVSVHIDKKTPISFVKDFTDTLSRKQHSKGEKGTGAYHKVPKGGELDRASTYVGTGVNLGVLTQLLLFTKAYQKGIIAGLRITPSDLTELVGNHTTGQINNDDVVTDRYKEIHKKKNNSGFN